MVMLISDGVSSLRSFFVVEAVNENFFCIHIFSPNTSFYLDFNIQYQESQEIDCIISTKSLALGVLLMYNDVRNTYF